MGTGYWILIGDGFGAGLVLINPRLHNEGLDRYGNPMNWWPAHDNDDAEAVIERHMLQNVSFVQVIFDNT